MTTGQLRLLKVPRWLSEQWLQSKPQDIVADLDLEQGILKLNSARAGCPTSMRVERRASPELFSFWQPLDGSEAPIEGIVESLTLQPDLKDRSYRSLLDQRKETETASSSRRSRHEERLIQGGERPTVVRATKTTHTESGSPGAALSDVLAAVETALQTAGTKGLTGLELFERLPSGGCTLAQLRDSLLALAIPIQAEDGGRRYVYAPCMGRGRNGQMMRWSQENGTGDVQAPGSVEQILVALKGLDSSSMGKLTFTSRDLYFAVREAAALRIGLGLGHGINADLASRRFENPLLVLSHLESMANAPFLFASLRGLLRCLVGRARDESSAILLEVSPGNDRLCELLCELVFETDTQSQERQGHSNDAAQIRASTLARLASLMYQYKPPSPDDSLRILERMLSLRTHPHTKIDAAYIAEQGGVAAQLAHGLPNLLPTTRTCKSLASKTKKVFVAKLICQLLERLVFPVSEARIVLQFSLPAEKAVSQQLMQGQTTSFMHNVHVLESEAWNAGKALDVFAIEAKRCYVLVLEENVRILPGVYYEQLSITEPVVLVGAGKELPTIWGGKDGVVVSGAGASACALRHLRLCAESSCHALTVSNSSPLIEGCEIVGSCGDPARGAPAGLEVRGQSCPVIRECRIFDHAGAGIAFLQGACGLTMSDNPQLQLVSVELANASKRAMFGAVGARCIAAVRCVTLFVVSLASAAGLMLLLSWQDDDSDSQRQFRTGATQPMAAAEARRPSAQEAAAAEALARHLRGPRPALDPLLDTPLSAASTIVSPALSDASWELPEAGVDTEPASRPPDEADERFNQWTTVSGPMFLAYGVAACDVTRCACGIWLEGEANPIIWRNTLAGHRGAGVVDREVIPARDVFGARRLGSEYVTW
ncbi:unnamed protein product [Symbiodinium sp. KB8]|nr:unnamed protein product [Symbiodinium sp. KB8]